MGTASSGIRLRSSLPATATLTLSENTITKWAQGINSEALAEGTKVELRRNWIFDNTGYGILNGNSEVIDAILNYWGHTSGPYHAEQNDDGQGNQVSNNVNFFPWYQDPQFVSVSDGTVHNVTQDRYYHSIQTAVDEAAPGDVIHVAPGVYSEDVIIEKSITLIGDPGDPGEPGPGPNVPILDGSKLPSPFTQCGFQVRNADNVVIEGFEIRNYQNQGLSLCYSENNVTFSYNYVHDVGGEGVKAYSPTDTGVCGWKVSNNIFEKVATGPFAYYGIWFVNVSQSEISNNVIRNHDHEMMVAINVAAKKNVGQEPVSGIIIKNNTIEGSANCIGFGSDDSPDKSALRDITIENNILTTTGSMALEGAAQISGTAVLRGNTIEVTEGEMGLQLWFWNGRTVEWTIENNDFEGINGYSYNAAIMYWDASESSSVAFEINGNTFTGWDKGILSYSPTTEAILRSNRFMGNNRAIVNSSSQIDARYNYWGHESGPYHENLNPNGQGNGISDNVVFEPWYIDEDYTMPSDESGEQGEAGVTGMKGMAEAPEPSISMTAGNVTFEEGIITLPVEVVNNGASLEGAVYRVALNLPGVAENVTALSASCNGEAFELTRDGADTFTGCFGLPGGFTIDESHAGTVIFTIDLSGLPLTGDLTAAIDAWVGLLSAPSEAVSNIEQVQTIILPQCVEDGICNMLNNTGCEGEAA